MNAPVYYLLHALPVVVILGIVFFGFGILVGTKLWKDKFLQAQQLRTEASRYDRMSADLSGKKDRVSS
jgi:hypothetical protein